MTLNTVEGVLAKRIPASPVDAADTYRGMEIGQAFVCSKAHWDKPGVMVFNLHRAVRFSGVTAFVIVWRRIEGDRGAYPWLTLQDAVDEANRLGLEITGYVDDFHPLSL